MSARTPLPLRETFYPLGFPLEIATNSADLHAAAREAWGSHAWEFQREPVRLRVIVAAGARGAAPQPVYRLQEGLLAIVADRDHFGALNLPARLGWCQVSADAVAGRAWFRWFFLEAMVYILLSQSDVVLVHAACVARRERGILLCGASGSGKSTLAYACARAGWEYLTDDGTALLQDSKNVEARAKQTTFRFRPETGALFPELGRYPVTTPPNQKPTIEVPVRDFPELATASRCYIDGIVFLERRQGRVALDPLTPADALLRLTHEMPDYGCGTSERQAQTLARLVAAPAYNLRYQTTAEAVSLLQEMVKG